MSHKVCTLLLAAGFVALLEIPATLGAPILAPAEYTYWEKDWASVLWSCKEVIKFEKRLGNYFVRDAFHDSGSVNPASCPPGDCPGLDASVFIGVNSNPTGPFNPVNERDRFENSPFSFIAMQAARKIADNYGVSIADVLAICAAATVEVFGGPAIIKEGGNSVRVGRYDSTVASESGRLPPPSFGVAQFVGFWQARGFSYDEMIALMGSHALLDNQGCYKGPRPDQFCNILEEDCTDVRMFKWDNHYFKDLCTGNITLGSSGDLGNGGTSDPDAQRKDLLCRFTSQKFRQRVDENARSNFARRGSSSPPENINVLWTNQGCAETSARGLGQSNCPHVERWFYTFNDGVMGRQGCQGMDDQTPEAIAIGNSIRKFLAPGEWDRAYPAAYLKMVNRMAKYAPGDPLFISGKECPSGKDKSNKGGSDGTKCSTATLDGATIVGLIELPANILSNLFFPGSA